MWDNPLLSPKYLRQEFAKYTGREREEEIEGKVFAESAGALWQQAWLDTHRRAFAPELNLILVSVDPAASARSDADEFGIIVGGRDDAGHAHLLSDHSGHHSPETWGDIVVSQCADHGAAGAVVERNKVGDNPTFVIRSRATTRGITVHVLEKHKPFPSRTPGRIYVREVVAASSKATRGSAPAAETEAGRVHVVGTLPELEQQLTTYEPGDSKSPNRLDAAVHLITELRGLSVDAPNDTPDADIAEALALQKALSEAASKRTLLDRIGLAGRRSVGL